MVGFSQFTPLQVNQFLEFPEFTDLEKKVWQGSPVFTFSPWLCSCRGRERNELPVPSSLQIWAWEGRAWPVLWWGLRHRKTLTALSALLIMQRRRERSFFPSSSAGMWAGKVGWRKTCCSPPEVTAASDPLRMSYGQPEWPWKWRRWELSQNWNRFYGENYVLKNPPHFSNSSSLERLTNMVKMLTRSEQRQEDLPCPWFVSVML